MDEAEEVLAIYDEWIAAGPMSEIGNTTCIKRRYERGPIWAEVWLLPAKHWHGEYPNNEIRRQLDDAKAYWAEHMMAKEYAHMC